MDKSQVKIVSSIILILLGAIFAVALVPSSDYSTTEGIIIDFGDYDAAYTGMPESNDSDAFSALEYACSKNNYSLVTEGDIVISINNVPGPDSDKTWKLFVTTPGQIEWKKSENPSQINIKEYSAIAWGLCSEGETPAPGVDATGYSFYNYEQPKRVITLAPSSTEIVCAVGARDTIIGTDLYSNYPNYIVEKQNKGSIAIIGGYTNPSYELILKQNPDMVIGIATVSGHLGVAERLREVGIDVIMNFDGQSIDSILDSTYMTGMGLKYDLSTEKTISSITEGMDTISNIISNYPIVKPSMMISLSAAKSPFVSGSDTYVSDVISYVSCINVYKDLSGWPQINSETIAENNPSLIIVASEYFPTQENYDKLMDSLSAEWKSTDAYKSGNIYLLSEAAEDLLSRPSVRLAQLTELTARLAHPEVFNDGIKISKFIGDDYEEYLTYTKDLDFND